MLKLLSFSCWCSYQFLGGPSLRPETQSLRPNSSLTSDSSILRPPNDPGAPKTPAQGWRLWPRRILDITFGFWGTYLRGSSSPMDPQPFLQVFSSIVDLPKLSISQSLQWFLHLLEGKERGDLDLSFHQSKSPLSEGNLLDLDLRVLCRFPLFFHSYLSIALVALVGFEWEGFEHFVCSCHCIWCISLSSPWRFVEVEVRSLLLLGSWNPRRLCGFVVPW
jgi:hypothetical protein